MGGKRLEIWVDVRLLDFSEINVTKMKMKVDFVLSLTWFDRRLEFFNLKPSFSLNKLTLNDLRSLWVPEIIFAQTEGNIISLLDESTEGHVLLNGSFDYNKIHENRYDDNLQYLLVLTFEKKIATPAGSPRFTKGPRTPSCCTGSTPLSSRATFG